MPTEPDLIHTGNESLRIKQYFTYDEMKCPCCGKCEMDRGFMNKLFTARMLANMIFIINSGYRCAEHDERIGSKSGNHRGYAVDISCAEEESGKRYRLIKYLLRAGFYRIGIYPAHIHVDEAPGKFNGIWIKL